MCVCAELIKYIKAECVHPEALLSCQCCPHRTPETDKCVSKERTKRRLNEKKRKRDKSINTKEYKQEEAKEKFMQNNVF